MPLSWLISLRIRSMSLFCEKEVETIYLSFASPVMEKFLSNSDSSPSDTCFDEVEFDEC